MKQNRAHLRLVHSQPVVALEPRRLPLILLPYTFWHSAALLAAGAMMGGLAVGVAFMRAALESGCVKP